MLTSPSRNASYGSVTARQRRKMSAMSGLVAVVQMLEAAPLDPTALVRHHLVGRDRRVVEQVGMLAHHVRHVDPETGEAAVQPGAQDRVELGGDGGVAPVEIGLIRGEQVQVRLTGELVAGPRRPAES